MKIKYPKVKVKLVGNSGNAFAILGAVKTALKKAGISQKEIDAYYEEATAGDYNHLLRITMRYVDVS